MGENWAIILICVLFTIFMIVIAVLFKAYKNRKSKDKPIIPQHRRLFRAPTWRFQKFHPSSCPHYNGIYREVELTALDQKIKKTIFVCADCVDLIDLEEIKQRDKFKK